MIENISILCSKIDNIILYKWQLFLLKATTIKCKINNLVSYYNTGADAIQKAPIVDFNTGIKCVRVGDFTNNREFEDWGYSDAKNDVFEQYKLKKGDILITRTASIGLVKYVNEDINSIYNNGIIRLRANDKIFPELLYMILTSDIFSNYIKGIEGGSSTRPNLKIKHVLDYEVKIPKPDEQKQINEYIKELFIYKNKLLQKKRILLKIKTHLLMKYFD